MCIRDRAGRSEGELRSATFLSTYELLSRSLRTFGHKLKHYLFVSEPWEHLRFFKVALYKFSHYYYYSWRNRLTGIHDFTVWNIPPPSKVVLHVKTQKNHKILGQLSETMIIVQLRCAELVPHPVVTAAGVQQEALVSCAINAAIYFILVHMKPHH